MIPGYSEQAANERTFLAWVRTGIAVIALGFVVEKFKMFLYMLSASASPELATKLHLERLSGALGRYGGSALVYGGLALIVISTMRFLRTNRLLRDPERHSGGVTNIELALLNILLLGIAAFAVVVAIG